MAKYLYGYHEERGFADLYVTDVNGNTVWEVHYPSFYESNGEMLEETTIFEDGFMKGADDIEGLEKYLKSISVINKGDELVDRDEDMYDYDADDSGWDYSYKKAFDSEYAAGGTIEAKIKKRLKNAFELPIQIAVYVPSTRDKDIIITKREMEARVDEVERFLANAFGGFSAVKVEGGFESSDKGLIQEDAVRVVAFASKENENGVPFEQSFESLMNQVKNWCYKWSQQSIGVEFENDLFYVDTETKFAGGGEVEDEVYNAYVVWIDDNDEAFFDGGWWSIEDAEDRVSDIEWEEDNKPKYKVFAVEYDEDYFENKNWDITRMKSYKHYPLTYKRGGKTYDYETYHNTLASALDEADKFVESRGFKFVDETYSPDVTMGGVSYGQTARLTRGIKKEGRKKEDVLTVVIYRMDSGKYELTMYTSYKKGGTTDDVKLNDIVWYRQPEDNFFFPKNTIYGWLYDDPKAAEKLESGEYDFVLFPASGGMGLMWQKGFVPPLLRVWTKKYQNKTKGSDRLIGIVQGWYDEDNKKLYIDMMTTRKDMRRKGVNSHIIRELRKELGLEREQVEFVNTTQDGEKFSKSSNYADGGDIAESNLQMLRSNAKAIKHHSEELENELNDNPDVEAWVVAKGERAATDLSDITHYLDGKKFYAGGLTAGRWYKDNSGEEFKYIGKNDDTGELIFTDGSKRVNKTLDEFGGRPKENKLFGFFEDGGIEEGVDLFEDYEEMPASVVETLSKYDLESGDYRELEKALKDLKKYGYTFDYELDGQPYDLRKIGQKGKSEFYAKGGSIKSIEKRVAEVNELIKRGNELGIEVVDEGNTWQAPMKYKPLKYTNGVLYISYEVMDLYKYNREYVQDWEKKSYKIGRYESSWGHQGEEGSAQREALTEIARMYRKPLKSYDTYGYFEDGGEVNKVNPEEIKVKIEQILDKVVPSFYKGVSIHKNIFDTGNNIRIFIAASDYKINGVSGQLPQVVSLSLDLSDMDLHPQVYGGNGGQRVERKPNMNDPKEKYLAMKGVKVPFRTPQPNEKAVLDAIKRFAENYKKTLAENREVLLYQDIVDYDKLLAGSQYADGGELPTGVKENIKYKGTRFEKNLGYVLTDEKWNEVDKKGRLNENDLGGVNDWRHAVNEKWGYEKYKVVMFSPKLDKFRNLNMKEFYNNEGYADGGISKDSKWYEANYKVQGLDSNVHFAAKSDREAIKLATNQLKRPNAELLNIYLVEGDKYTIIYGDSWESIRDTPKMAKGGVIASSTTKEGIEKLIGDYYYSKNISLKKLDDKDEYEVSNSKGKINGVKVIVKKGRYQFVESDKMAMGGTFAAGVKAIEKRLVGTKVNPKYQKEYGKTYDKAEAHEAASKIKGKMRAMELAKKYKKKK
jgi:hypothetical protein